MSYLKCVLIYVAIACITGVIDRIFKFSFKEENGFSFTVRLLISLGLGGYCIYYLLNIYI